MLRGPGGLCRGPRAALSRGVTPALRTVPAFAPRGIAPLLPPAAARGAWCSPPSLVTLPRQHSPIPICEYKLAA